MKQLLRLFKNDLHWRKEVLLVWGVGILDSVAAQDLKKSKFNGKVGPVALYFPHFVDEDQLEAISMV